MALTKKKRYKNLTMRRATRQSPGGSTFPKQAHLPIPTALAHSGSILTITFDTPVVLSSVLPAWTNNSQHVISAAQTSPTVVVLTFSGATAAGNVVVPQYDGGIHGTPAGGFVQPGTYTAT